MRFWQGLSWCGGAIAIGSFLAAGYESHRIAATAPKSPESATGHVYFFQDHLVWGYVTHGQLLELGVLMLGWFGGVAILILAKDRDGRK